MRIVYCGNGTRGAICLSAILDQGREVAGVIVHHGGADEKNQNAVAQIARKAGLTIMDPKNINSPEAVQELQDCAPDIMVMAGYNQILKKPVVDLLPGKILNLHGGKLPAYRGGSPTNWQIINGEISGGCAIIFADEGIDTGDIICQEEYAIGPDDTAGQIAEQINEIFPRLLLSVLDDIEVDRVTAQKQNPAKGAYFCKRYPEDGLIDWCLMSDVDVHNLVRALNGPGLSGAFCFDDSAKIVIWETSLLADDIVGVPGRVWQKRGDGVVVICRNRGILVKKVKSDGSAEAVAAFQVLAANKNITLKSQ